MEMKVSAQGTRWLSAERVEQRVSPFNLILIQGVWARSSSFVNTKPWWAETSLHALSRRCIQWLLVWFPRFYLLFGVEWCCHTRMALGMLLSKLSAVCGWIPHLLAGFPQRSWDTILLSEHQGWTTGGRGTDIDGMRRMNSAQGSDPPLLAHPQGSCPDLMLEQLVAGSTKGSLTGLWASSWWGGAMLLLWAYTFLGPLAQKPDLKSTLSMIV